MSRSVPSSATITFSGLRSRCTIAVLVQVRERVGELVTPVARQVDRDRSVQVADPAPEVLALDVLEHQVRLGPVGVVVEAAQHVGMVEARHDLGLAAEALEVVRVGEEVRVEALEDDGGARVGVARLVGLGVRALTQLVDDLVAVDPTPRRIAHSGPSSTEEATPRGGGDRECGGHRDRERGDVIGRPARQGQLDEPIDRGGGRWAVLGRRRASTASAISARETTSHSPSVHSTIVSARSDRLPGEVDLHAEVGAEAARELRPRRVHRRFLGREQLHPHHLADAGVVGGELGALGIRARGRRDCHRRGR